MVSKSSAVHSVRIPNDLWEWVVAEAKRREITPNAHVVELLSLARRGLDRVNIGLAQIAAKEAAARVEHQLASQAKIVERLNKAEKGAAAKVSVPFAGDVVRRPTLKKDK